MILEEETFKKFGYYPSELTPQSHKKILAACDGCGKIRERYKNSYRDFCLSCVNKENPPRLGKHHTEETKKKMSDTQKGKKHPFWGKKHSESTRRKMSETHSGENNPMFGKRGKDTSGWRGGKVKRICEICGKEFEVFPYMIKRGRGRFHSRSCARKAKKIPTHHTKPELIFEEICKNNNLDFHYVGDGQLWIGKKDKKQLNPDFIEANGKKICVEIMGRYWHSPLLNQNLREDALQSYREKHYKKYKWIPVFIWDTDLLRTDADTFVLMELEKGGVM